VAIDWLEPRPDRLVAIPAPSETRTYLFVTTGILRQWWACVARPISPIILEVDLSQSEARSGKLENVKTNTQTAWTDA